MKRNSWRLFVSLVGLVLPAFANTIYWPPRTGGTIQDGIDIASNGDTVIVSLATKWRS